MPNRAYIYIYIGGEEAQLALKLKRSNSGNDWVGMDLETISQNASCYFGLVGLEKKKNCAHKHTHTEMIQRCMAFSTLLFSLLYFFSGLPGKEDFPKFALALPTMG